jgi:SRSO17 transposase
MDHPWAPDAVLVIDETGFLKQGRHSAGVARQYSGTAGRIENCQIGVFLAYTSRHGHVLMDRELYLPEEWSNDKARCQQAGIPEHRGFATKPALAKQMLSRALAAGVLATWVTGDSVYGDDRRLRMWLEAQPQAYVLAVSGKEYVWLSCPQPAGPASVQAMGPKACGGMMGVGCPWPSPWSRTGAAGCWYGAA